MSTMTQFTGVPAEKKEAETIFESGKKGVSLMGGIFLLCLSVLGSGILSVPGTFVNAGWVVATFFFCLVMGISICCSYCYVWSFNLAKSLYPDEKIVGLEHVANLIWGRWFAILVGIVHYFDVWFNVAILLVTLGVNTKAFLEDYLDEDKVQHSYRIVVAVGAVIVYPLCLAKDLQYLSKGAVIAMMSTFALIIAVMYANIQQIIDKDPLPKGYDCPLDMAYKPAFGDDFSNVMSAINIISYTFAISELVPAIYSDVRRKTKFGAVIWWGHGFCLATYMLMGFTAFYAYGAVNAAADQTTELMLNKGAKAVVAISVIIHTIIDLPLWLHPVCLFFEEHTVTWIPSVKPIIVQVLTRTLLLGAATGVAMIGDQVQPLQAVAGALTTTLSCTVIPCIFYLVLATRAQNKLKEVTATGEIAAADAEDGAVVPAVSAAVIGKEVDPISADDHAAILPEFTQESSKSDEPFINNVDSEVTPSMFDDSDDEFEEPDLNLKTVHKEIRWYVLLFCILSFVMGAFMATVGMYFAVKDIIAAWGPSKSSGDEGTNFCVKDNEVIHDHNL